MLTRDLLVTAAFRPESGDKAASSCKIRLRNRSRHGGGGGDDLEGNGEIFVDVFLRHLDPFHGVGVRNDGVGGADGSGVVVVGDVGVWDLGRDPLLLLVLKLVINGPLFLRQILGKLVLAGAQALALAARWFDVHGVLTVVTEATNAGHIKDNTLAEDVHDGGRERGIFLRKLKSHVPLVTYKVTALHRSE